MNVLYIKKQEESKLKNALNIVELEEIFNGYIAKIPLQYEKCRLKNYLIARKIKKIVNEKNIDGIVLADDVSCNKEFVDILISKRSSKRSLNKIVKKNSKNKNASQFIKERKIYFFDGKVLFKYIIYEILEYIIKEQNRKPELEDIYIVVNAIDETMLENIIFLTTKFKNVNIVSKNIENYNYIENLIYKRTENNVILLNNRRKSLKRAKYIVNVDNSKEELNQYLIYRKAIIINMKTSEKTTLQKKNAEKDRILLGFEGIMVNSFEIDVKDEIKEKLQKCGLTNITNMAILYESILNVKESFKNVRLKIEETGLVVTKLYGNNGIIDKNEYRRVNMADNEAKKCY